MYRFLAILVFIFATPRCSLLAGGAGSTRAYIAEASNASYPTAVCSLGDLQVSKRKQLVVELVNTTSNKLVFNSVRRACSCTKVSPQSGSINPNESLELNLDFATVDVPVSLESSLMLVFEMNEAPEFALRLSYDVKKYFSLQGGLVVASDDKNGRFHFSVPYLKSDDIELSQVEISLVGAAEDVELGFSPGERLVQGSFECESSESSASVLKAKIADSQLASEVTVVSEKYKEFRVFPGRIRFSAVNKSDSENWTAIFFVKRDMGTESVAETHSPMRIETAFGEERVAAKVDMLSSSLARVAVTTQVAAEDVRKALLAEDRGVNSVAHEEELTVFVTAGHAKQTFVCKAIFFGVSK